jgi:hypothetical protein
MRIKVRPIKKLPVVYIIWVEGMMGWRPAHSLGEFSTKQEAIACARHETSTRWAAWAVYRVDYTLKKASLSKRA